MRTIEKRDDLVLLINDLGLKTGVEIGVCEGRFSEHLLAYSSLDRLYSVDAWCDDMEQTMSSFKRCDLKDGEMERRLSETQKRLSRFGNRSEIRRAFSVQAADTFEDNSLDFIYLDASHTFSGFALDMIKWWPKLKVGGIYAGHDYWTRYRYHTCYVVCGFCVEMKQFFRLTTHERRDFPPSWYLQKSDRTKGEYVKRLPEEIIMLKNQVKYINSNCLFKCDLPYEYMSDRDGLNE